MKNPNDSLVRLSRRAMLLSYTETTQHKVLSVLTDHVPGQIGLKYEDPRIGAAL